MYSTTIPFSGFYNSLHDGELDEAVRQAFSDRGTGCHVNEDLVERAMGKLDWRRVHSDYAEEYCENFAVLLGIKLEFDELVSPREYNFTTDRIFAKMDEATLLDIRNRVDDGVLLDTIRKNHTGYDGFYSFYKNTLGEWPDDVTEWDHNQVGTLVEALLLTEFPDWDHWKEYGLMEDDRGNGIIDNILFECPYMQRLDKVWYYLDQTRPARAKRA